MCSRMYDNSEARRIKREYQQGCTIEELARMHHLSKGTIINIITDYRAIRVYLRKKKKLRRMTKEAPYNG